MKSEYLTSALFFTGAAAIAVCSVLCPRVMFTRSENTELDKEGRPITTCSYSLYLRV